MNFLLFSLLLLPGRPITLEFHNTIGGRPLQLFNQVYTNRLGEPFVVMRLRYYISRISVTGPDGVETLLSDRSYLIEEDQPGSKTILLTGAPDDIRSVIFQVGVDSALNTGGVQEGDLDPARGMFWTWNSGYIFARLEGRSDSSHAPAHSLTWDIGGYRTPANALRTVKLGIPAGHQNGQSIVVDTDLLTWFDGCRQVRIAEHPVCHQAGALAMQIADNYAAGFSIKQ